ncbi:MAG TPA: N-acetyltransferase [Prevotellaceae bacterium]|nr:N-acetyltransferase [Prevotellaceae bacterium]
MKNAISHVPPVVRQVDERDMPQVRAIYDKYVRHTAFTFDYAAPTVEKMTHDMHEVLCRYPYLVCAQGDEVKGYAYAHSVSPRESYKWTVELSIYLDTDSCGRGIGHRLYGALLSLLRCQNVQTAYACITHPNPVSERFHQSMGFSFLAKWPHSGYKFGRWYDVVWMEKRLGPCPVPAPELVCFNDLPAQVVRQILDEP